jgi:hypothetical protein
VGAAFSSQRYRSLVDRQRQDDDCSILKRLTGGKKQTKKAGWFGRLFEASGV